MLSILNSSDWNLISDLFVFCVAVQALRRDREGRACQLWQRLWEARRHRRRYRPEQSNVSLYEKINYN